MGNRNQWAEMSPEARKAKAQRDYARKTPEQIAAKRETTRLWRERIKAEGVEPHEACSDHTRDEILKVLDGAIRVTRSPRGFVKYNPQPNNRLLLDQVQAVLEEYSTHLPLTVRQIFYRLLDRHGYKKSDIESRIYDVVEAARRAEIIDMGDIRDDGGVQEEPTTWRNADEIIDNARTWAQTMQLDRQIGQRKRLFICCEAAGMVPQLARVAEPYSIPVLSSGGADSLTEKHGLALRASQSTEPPGNEILYIGDLDAHGVTSIFIPLCEDVSAFADHCGCVIDVTRLAVTKDQVEELGLDTTPYTPPTPEPGKSRPPAYPHDFTCQAEAIAPDDLATLVQSAIDQRLDQEAYDAILRREKRVRAEALRRLK